MHDDPAAGLMMAPSDLPIVSMRVRESGQAKEVGLATAPALLLAVGTGELANLNSCFRHSNVCSN